MRYYRILVTDPVSGKTVTLASGARADWSSTFNGTPDPGALLVEIDIPVTMQATPSGLGQVIVWGVSLTDIGQASDLNGKLISVFGGMSPGLPLATAAYNAGQQGLLAQGTIFQAFGNWVGTDQNLTLVFFADVGSNDNPKNFTLNWPKGQLLATAIAATLTTAFPSYTLNISISNNLVLANDEVGYFATLGQFASYLKIVSLDVVGGTYQGVDIAISDNIFSVYDGTSQTDPVAIVFNDLIGQPTWIDAATIQLNCVMRADLSVGDYITLPKTPVITTSQSQPQARDKSVFQGTFQINLIRHVGNSRDPNASSWISTINAFPQPITLLQQTTTTQI